jgi:hypothetical protein
MEDVNEAINEFFKLKSKFEESNEIQKKRILDNQSLSKKEKRREFLSLKPKCINCEQPSKVGTFFSITYHPSDKKIDKYRIFKSSCGNLANPCNLNIEINVGVYESIDKLANLIQSYIIETKNEIIKDKNNLLFGLETTENAIELFESNKDYINEFTLLYEKYIDKWIKITDNPDEKKELNEAILTLYENIDKIKLCIQQMNETNDIRFAKDAATIYYTIIEPLSQKIQKLKYNENYVYYNEETGMYHLVQHKNKIEDLLITSFVSKVVSFDIGIKPTNDDLEKEVSEKEVPEKEVDDMNDGKNDLSLLNPFALKDDTKSSSGGKFTIKIKPNL